VSCDSLDSLLRLLPTPRIQSYLGVLSLIPVSGPAGFGPARDMKVAHQGPVLPRKSAVERPVNARIQMVDAQQQSDFLFATPAPAIEILHLMLVVFPPEAVVGELVVVVQIRRTPEIAELRVLQAERLVRLRFRGADEEAFGAGIVHHGPLGVVVQQPRGQFLVPILLIELDRHTDLPEVAEARRLPGLLAGLGEDREENGRQNGDDGDDDQ
jgi:hypothetical protein